MTNHNQPRPHALPAPVVAQARVRALGYELYSDDGSADEGGPMYYVCNPRTGQVEHIDRPLSEIEGIVAQRANAELQARVEFIAPHDGEGAIRKRIEALGYKLYNDGSDDGEGPLWYVVDPLTRNVKHTDRPLSAIDEWHDGVAEQRASAAAWETRNGAGARLSDVEDRPLPADDSRDGAYTTERSLVNILDTLTDRVRWAAGTISVVMSDVDDTDHANALSSADEHLEAAGRIVAELSAYCSPDQPARDGVAERTHEHERADGSIERTTSVVPMPGAAGDDEPQRRMVVISEDERAEASELAERAKLLARMGTNRGDEIERSVLMQAIEEAVTRVEQIIDDAQVIAAADGR